MTLDSIHIDKNLLMFEENKYAFFADANKKIYSKKPHYLPHFVVECSILEKSNVDQKLRRILHIVPVKSHVEEGGEIYFNYEAKRIRPILIDERNISIIQFDLKSICGEPLTSSVHCRDTVINCTISEYF